MKENRRQFLAKSGCALSMVALATQARHFGVMSALAQSADVEPSAAPGDYRALVCIFLAGGNDGNNMVIPNHSDASVSNYQAYANARNTQGLAIAQNQLLSISVPRIGNLTYGLHPRFGVTTGQPNNGIYELYAQGKLAVVPNVGNLVAPMTRAQYQQNSVAKPYQLFSHSDQIAQQQAGIAGRQSFAGIGGRIADKMQSSFNPSSTIPMITSISGASLFTIGQTTSPLAISSGNVALNQVLVLQGYDTSATSTARRTALNQIRAINEDANLIQAENRITDAAVQASAALSTAVEVTVTFPNTNLGNQLKQVARVIKRRDGLGTNRQIFYCLLGGFDTHSGQVASATTG